MAEKRTKTKTARELRTEYERMLEICAAASGREKKIIVEAERAKIAAVSAARVKLKELIDEKGQIHQELLAAEAREAAEAQKRAEIQKPAAAPAQAEQPEQPKPAA